MAKETDEPDVVAATMAKPGCAQATRRVQWAVLVAKWRRMAEGCPLPTPPVGERRPSTICLPEVGR